MKLLVAAAATAAFCCDFTIVDAFFLASSSSSTSSSRMVTHYHHRCCRMLIKPPRPQTRRCQGTISDSGTTTVSLQANNNSSSSSSSSSDLSAITSRQKHTAIAPTTAATTATELVPSTWSQALHRFFLGEDIGPSLVVLTIFGFIYTRYQLLSSSTTPTPSSIIMELFVFSSAIVLWWVQEYFFHKVLLHSPSFHWIGKSIHKTHHEKDYFHVSIDPPQLLLGWLFVAHFIFRVLIPPFHLCLSATIGYSIAGLVYEWSHYIVHTKVKPPRFISTSSLSSCNNNNNKQQSSFLERILILPIMRKYSKMRDNHIRHHLIDSRYWYAFSVTEMDDLFHTNPNVKELKTQMKAIETTRERENQTERGTEREGISV